MLKRFYINMGQLLDKKAGNSTQDTIKKGRTRPAKHQGSKLNDIKYVGERRLHSVTGQI